MVTAHPAVSGTPGPPTVGRLLLHWSPEVAPLLAVALLAGLYLLGVRRLRRRGDSWSAWRTAAWLGGLVVVLYAVAGGVEQYDTVLFSAHAVQHMLLATVAPIPLALGAPITLALRTLPGRPRRALLRLLHTRLARVLAFPLVGFAILVVSLYGLYFTSLYPATLEHPWLHDLVHLHFLVSGCVFFWPIVGLDPIPGRQPYWARLILLFITFPVHALFGLALMTTDEVFAAEHYRQVARTWGSSLLTDQRTGGGIMWAAGELVGALVFVALFVQWSRAEERVAVREDRRLDRLEARARTRSPAAPGPVAAAGPATSEDALLAEREAAYNAWLGALAAADERRARRG